MKPEPQELKVERIQFFPQPSFSASAAFLTKAAALFEKHDRALFVFVDATGVTVWLGNTPESGVSETEHDLVAALNGLTA